MPFGDRTRCLGYAPGTIAASAAPSAAEAVARGAAAAAAAGAPAGLTADMIAGIRMPLSRSMASPAPNWSSSPAGAAGAAKRRWARCPRCPCRPEGVAERLWPRRTVLHEDQGLRKQPPQDGRIVGAEARCQ